jgi:hypothetical protein
MSREFSLFGLPTGFVDKFRKFCRKSLTLSFQVGRMMQPFAGVLSPGEVDFRIGR